MGKDHLVEVLRLVEETNFSFILETNGTLIDAAYAKELARFRNLSVRVSLKGSTPEEFARLTGARPESFQLQLDALKNLAEAGARFHPAVMLSFSTPESIGQLKENLKLISSSLPAEMEEEYIFLYPHVKERLKKAGIKPAVSYNPRGIPEELI